ncbi:hypothetical protein UlMin_002146, partial [Ulmus minor]
MPLESNPYVAATVPPPASSVKNKMDSVIDVLGKWGKKEKMFRQNFESTPEEQLLKKYACYLSTYVGPVMGILYLSTAKLAFCSDNPLSYKNIDQTEWSCYKVVLPLHQLKAVNPSTSKVNLNEIFLLPCH